MFGLMENTRKIEGEIFVQDGEFESQDQARQWAANFQAYGFKARIIPNASRQVFEVWISQHPAACAAPAAQAAKAPQE